MVSGGKIQIQMNPRQLFEQPDLSLLCASDIESQIYERKTKQTPKRIAEIVSGFANINLQGGLIAIGIADDGSIDGLLHRFDVNVNELLRYQNLAGVLTEHKLVDCTNSQGLDDQVLLIYVPYEPNRVVETSSGKAFVRRGDQTVELKYKERRQLEYQKGQSSFEDEPVCELSNQHVAQDILKELCASVAKKDKHALKHSSDEILANCHLTVQRGGKPFLTNAGILLLCKDPRSFIPGTYLRFRRFQGRKKLTGAKHNVVKDETFYGPLPLIIKKSVDYISTQIREFSYLGKDGRFVNEPEYPPFALTEAIVNALIHRSYSERNRPVFVEMYDDRVEVISPGDYPIGVSPNQFFHNPRNPHLMRVMKYLEFVKMASEGIPRIQEEMQELGLPSPAFSPPGQPSVTIVLQNDIDVREARMKVPKEARGTEFANLFQLTVEGPEVSEGAVIEGTDQKEFLKNLRATLAKRLRETGWAIDSFTQDRAIAVKNEFATPDLRQFAAIYPGFRFRVKDFQGLTALCIDPTIEISNRASLEDIQKHAPEMLTWGVRKGFVKRDSSYLPGRVLNIADNVVELLLHNKEDTSMRTKVDYNSVIPVLPMSWVSHLIKRAGIKADLYQITQRLAFSTGDNPARKRSEETTRLTSELKKTVFPLHFDGYKVDLDTNPIVLSNFFNVRKDLSEAAPVFNKPNPQSSYTVIDGLSQYGSYERPEKDAPVVILCTPDSVQGMQSLVQAIQQGSFRYKGLERTFSLSTKPVLTYVTSSCNEYLSKCQEIIQEVPEHALFLVYCPEAQFSRADYNGPYYQVKRFLFERGFPSQMVDEGTVRSPKFKDFNLALNIFAKLGYVPWVLSEGMPNADLFLGLSYSSIGASAEERKRVLAYVNVFDRYGKWLYYRGNAAPIKFEERNNAFRSLLDGIVRDYETKAILQRMHIHHDFSLSYEARKEIAKGVWNRAPEAEVSFAYINSRSNIRLYDWGASGDGSLERGTYVVINPNHFLMATTGYNELGQKGIGTPRSLEVRVNRLGAKGEIDPRIYAQHVLSLTRLNWASTKSFCREPITLKFAGDIAYLMAAFMKSSQEFKLHPRLERTPWFL